MNQEPAGDLQGESTEYPEILQHFKDRPWVNWPNPNEKQFDDDFEKQAYIKEYLDAAKQGAYFAVQAIDSDSLDELQGKTRDEWKKEYEEAEAQRDAINKMMGLGDSQRYFEED